MQTECIPDIFGFEAVAGPQVIAAFDGGTITSDAGALLLGATDRAIRMVDRPFSVNDSHAVSRTINSF